MEEMTTPVATPTATPNTAHKACGCGDAHGTESCCQDGKEVCEGRCGEKSENYDVWTLAGSILLGSLIIAASILVAPNKQAAPAAQPTNPNPSAAQPAQPTVTMDQVRKLMDGKNLAFGKKDSKLVFVEFSDPSCPFCHIAGGKNGPLNKQAGAQFTLVADGGTYIAPVPEMKKLVDSGKAAFVWLYANGHGNGEVATRALYCANDQGKFWPVHDLLMSEAGYNLINNEVKNDLTKTAQLTALLKNAANAKDLETCITSGKYDDRLASDMALAQQFGFRGTPSFFVNETNFPGAVSFKDMQSAVDKVLK